MILGLDGFEPETYDSKAADAALERIRREGQVTPDGLPPLRFAPATDLVFDYDTALPGHTNGLRLMATDRQGDVILSEVYYSIGGGFVLTEDEMEAPQDATTAESLRQESP